MTGTTGIRAGISRVIRRHWRGALAAGMVAFALVVAACGGTEPTETTSGSAPSTTQATTTTTSAPPTTEATTTTSVAEEEALASGLTERATTAAGRPRSYALFVPASLDQGRSAPLVLNLHGAGDTAAAHVSYSNFNETAEEAGIIVAYPDAIDQFWNMEDGSDIEFVSVIIDEVSALTPIDADRVYLLGMSQGGDFAALLACRLPDRFAAVASVAVLNHHDEAGCEQPRPARIMTVMGLADPTTSEGLPFEAPPGVDLPGPLVEEEADWAATNSCDPTPTETEPAENVTRADYQCANSAALAVLMHAGDHIWPQPDVDGLDTNAVVWEFLQQYSGPIPGA